MAMMANQMSIQEEINRALVDLPPGTRAFTLTNIKIFAAPGVLNCLGLAAAAHGDMNAALGEGGALRKGPGVYAALTNQGLPPSYIQSEIDNDTELTSFDASEDSPINLAIAQYDTRDGDAASLRGFALLQVKNQEGEIIREEQDNCSVRTATMELKVLGNKVAPGVNTRSNKIFPRGGNIIRLVQFLGSKLDRGIFLYGLETVISLYRYFGWEVTSARRAEDSICGIDTHSMMTRQKTVPKQMAAFQRKYGPDETTNTEIQRKNRTKDNLGSPEAYEEALQNILKFFPGKGYYDKLAKAEDGTVAASKQDTKLAKVEESRDQGYPMLLCPGQNPYSSVATEITKTNESKQTKSGGGIPMLNIVVDNKTSNIKGGRKIRKRRTKKRALRKKHRGRKTKGKKKKKKNKKWCKSTKAWCKYTKKNNCKKGLWKKKTKLGRASRRWCRSTKRWCKVRKTACKKKRR